MKKSFYKIWFIASITLFFTDAVYAQAPSTIAKIDTLLKKTRPETKSVRMVGNLLIIDQKNNGIGYGFEVPYDSVDYSYTYSTQSRKDTSYNVNIKCTDNKDCLTIYDDNKEYRKKNIWFSFVSQSGAEEFISLMEKLKEEK